MDDLVRGGIQGFLTLLVALPFVISTLSSYGFYNSYQNKRLVIIVGLVIIVLMSYSVGFGTSFIDYCDKTGCHYEELPTLPLGWSAVGSTLVTSLLGFGLGLFLAHNFPWREPEEEKMLTSKEVSEILQIPEATVVMWVGSKYLFGIKYDNGFAKIPQRSLNEWLKKFSQISSLADKTDNWITSTMIEKTHLIRSRKEAI